MVMGHLCVLRALLYVLSCLLIFSLLLQDKMAVPPSYGNLGKSAKDIFNKGYGMPLK